jgi:hypothetical protein
MFFSISSKEYADALLDEIYGCFKYIGIPIDTVMSLPTQTRKYFISRHNYECEKQNKSYSNQPSSSITGEATNEYTKMSMNDYKRLGPR